MSKDTGGLRSYILRRILYGALVIFAVVIFNFLLIHSAPGSPAYIMAGEISTPEYVAQIEREWGLDQPIYTQLGVYIFQVFQGNFGHSYVYGASVMSVIMERVNATLLLMISVIILAALAGTILGVIASLKVHSVLDNVLSVGALMGRAVPSFWSAQIVLLVFAVYLGWFPAQGMFSVRVQYTGLAYYLDILYHAFLPIANLSLVYLAIIFRLTRASMLEHLNEDYIVTARAKGLGERAVLFKHTLRNAVLPIISVVGSEFSLVLGGAVVTETIFGWPGIGRLVATSIYARDYPVLMGVFIIVAVMVVVVNLVTDIIYAFIDPRIRYK
ncbi:MAG TPA: ABC transporter permease [Patescibacteria group bacterium]|nr:ABC transporter permease [Patescibacteria group bacterium]